VPEAPENGTSVERAAVERALMDRVRVHAAREHEKPPRRLLQHALALAAALSLVAVILFGFDAFLTAMQKFMDTKIEEPASAPAATEPMPAFVVEPEVSPRPPGDPGPRPSPAQAPGTSPATP
jgi:hypothetical protein